MTTTTQGTPRTDAEIREPYFIDQYGYIYRWAKKEGGGKQSVIVASWQQQGSAKEAIDIVNAANASSQALARVAELEGALRLLLKYPSGQYSTQDGFDVAYDNAEKLLKGKS